MLSFLSLQLRGSQWTISVTLYPHEGGLMVITHYPYEPECDSIRSIPALQAQKWLDDIEALHIADWRKEAFLPLDNGEHDEDDEGSTLVYHFAGMHPVQLDLYIDYPHNWPAFIALIDQVAPVIDPQRIEAFTVKYVRATNVPVKNIGWGEPDFAPGVYHESIVLNSSAQTLTIRQTNQYGSYVCREFHIAPLILRLQLFLTRWFDAAAFPPSQHVGDAPRYHISLTRHDGSRMEWYGSFCRTGLPAQWGALARMLTASLNIPEHDIDLLSSEYYGIGAAKDELTICSVAFPGGGKSYYYGTDDSSLRVGDLVVVPAGSANRETVVQIVNIAYFTEDRAPYPLQKLKRILRRFLPGERL